MKSQPYIGWFFNYPTIKYNMLHVISNHKNKLTQQRLNTIYAR